MKSIYPQSYLSNIHYTNMNILAIFGKKDNIHFCLALSETKSQVSL